MFTELGTCSILAGYDLGAPASLLQKMYDAELEGLLPIHEFGRKEGKAEVPTEAITFATWTKYLGDET